MNKELGHGENFLVKHYAGSVVYTVTGMYFMAPIYGLVPKCTVCPPPHSADSFLPQKTSEHALALILAHLERVN